MLSPSAKAATGSVIPLDPGGAAPQPPQAIHVVFIMYLHSRFWETQYINAQVGNSYPVMHMVALRNKIVLDLVMFTYFEQRIMNLN